VHRVNGQLSRLLARLAMLGVLALALGLTACGRKGGLDLPPSAVAEPPAAAGADNPAAAQTGFGPDGRPTMSPGAKKRLPIDALLD
jgi:predicted small lipoprotein YifL